MLLAATTTIWEPVGIAVLAVIAIAAGGRWALEKLLSRLDKIDDSLEDQGDRLARVERHVGLDNDKPRPIRRAR